MATIRTWIERVRRLAETGLEGSRLPEPGGAEAWLNAFRDEFGHRRALDLAFLRHAMGAPPSARTPASDSAAAVWHAVIGNQRAMPGVAAPPMFPARARDGIEIWTEEELSGLHARWWLDTPRTVPNLIERFAPLVRWHVETLQPDNATQRPWGAHVFFIVGVVTGDAEAMLHADTLVHASIVRLGKPDLVSSLVLGDAASAAAVWLDAQAG